MLLTHLRCQCCCSMPRGSIFLRSPLHDMSHASHHSHHSHHAGDGGPGPGGGGGGGGAGGLLGRRDSDVSDAFLSPEAYRATQAVEFIAEHLRNEDEYVQVSELSYKYAALKPIGFSLALCCLKIEWYLEGSQKKSMKRRAVPLWEEKSYPDKKFPLPPTRNQSSFLSRRPLSSRNLRFFPYSDRSLHTTCLTDPGGLEVRGDGGGPAAAVRLLHRDDGGHRRHPHGRAAHLRVR